MDSIQGEIIGDIHIIVCETADGDKFFKILANNENVLPVLDIINDILVAY